MSTFVIAGASLAGAKAAETLRAEGHTGRIVLIGAEKHLPYERPPLSKGLLLGDAEEDSWFVHDQSWYAGHDVDLRLGTVVEALDRAAREVTLSSGDRLGYDRLLLATGSSPRPLPLAGDVLYLRTLDEAKTLAGRLADGTRLTVIGAGWIGLEAAAAARSKGAEVTVVTPDAVPLQKVLGEQVGAMFAKLHTEQGVEFRFGRQVTELRDGEVVLDDGTVLAADLVLAAIGATPVTALAEQAGLDVGDGILVDAQHRTSDPDVYAAGDVAAVDHPLLKARIRVEHWDNALRSGPAAARSMLGKGEPWQHLPYFFTDQYDLGMEYAGWVAPGTKTEIVVRGDFDGRECVVFWTSGGRVLAGMNVNVWDVTDQIQDLIRAGRPVDPARLADPAVPLADLA